MLRPMHILPHASGSLEFPWEAVLIGLSAREQLPEDSLGRWGAAPLQLLAPCELPLANLQVSSRAPIAEMT